MSASEVRDIVPQDNRSHFNFCPDRSSFKCSPNHAITVMTIISIIVIAIFVTLGIVTVDRNSEGSGSCCIPYNRTDSYCPSKVIGWIYCCDPESNSLPVCDKGQANIGFILLISAFVLASLSISGCTIFAQFSKRANERDH